MPEFFDTVKKNGVDITTNSKSITVESPTASENIALFFTTRAITVTHVADVVKGSSPSVTWNIQFAANRNEGSPTSLFSSNRATTSLTGATATSFANAAIPANRWVWLISSAMSGTTSELNVTITFTLD